MRRYLGYLSQDVFFCDLCCQRAVYLHGANDSEVGVSLYYLCHECGLKVKESMEKDIGFSLPSELPIRT